MQQVPDQNGSSSGSEQVKPEQEVKTSSKCIRTPQETSLPDHTFQNMGPGMIQTTIITPSATEKLHPYSKDSAEGRFVCGLAATKSTTEGLVSASVTASGDVIQSCLHPGNLKECTTIASEVVVPVTAHTENGGTKPSSSHAGGTAISSAQEGLKKSTKYIVKRSAIRGRKPSIKKYILRSLASTDRDLQTKAKGMSKAPEAAPREQKKRKRKKGAKISVVDEYSRIRKHLRYLMQRISYEQSLITAYSTEGWKGLSLEKLKPEKELERARSEILRRKLKIRDLFRHLDSLCSEGKLPESLFDSEGEIDSEDIFCSKCGSEDLSVNNDIILCDGACDRGFHQYCLQPPLLKEEIPPDGESWLCPGCDCKDDCVELVNEAQGTNLCITDGWEKVFPEAAGGHNQDPNFGLPSDDSDDNDYNPDGLEDKGEDKGSENSSDESDFTSASDELVVAPKTEPLSGLPSDDSDDEDYDPDAPLPDDISKQESSTSDFSSDSEDLGAVLKDDSLPPEGGLVITSLSKNAKRKTCSPSKDLLPTMESTPDLDISDPVSEKRSIERLDYKKLYDETYGNVSSSSSDDDDDWAEATVPKKIRNRGKTSVSQNGNSSSPRSGMISKKRKQNLEMKEHSPRSTAARKSKSVATLRGSRSQPGSSGQTARASANRRLEEAAKQRLSESFKQNQYPDRATKENLAKELQVTFNQVSKWFENTRWSANHRSTTGTSGTAETDSPSQQQPEMAAGDSNCEGSKHMQSPSSNPPLTDCRNGDAKAVTPRTSKETPKTPRSRRKKKKC